MAIRASHADYYCVSAFVLYISVTGPERLSSHCIYLIARGNHDDVHLATEKRNALWCVLYLVVFETRLNIRISAIGAIGSEGF